MQGLLDEPLLVHECGMNVCYVLANAVSFLLSAWHIFNTGLKSRCVLLGKIKNICFLGTVNEKIQYDTDSQLLQVWDFLLDIKLKWQPNTVSELFITHNQCY